MSSKIRIDDVDFINYQGIKEIELPLGWETVYNQLVNDNAIENIAQGVVFLDQNIHTKYQRSLLVRYKLPRLSFWADLLDRFLSGPFRLNRDLRFTGAFRIVNYDQMRRPPYEKTGCALRPTSFSYLSVIGSQPESVETDIAAHSKRVKLKSYEEFTIESNQTHIDPLGRASIPNATSDNFVNDDDLIKEKLYFRLHDVVTACTLYFEQDFDYKNTTPDLEYQNGIKLKAVNQELQKNVTSVSENHQKLETSYRVLAACFWVMQNKNRPHFGGNEDIYKHFERHFKGIPGLKKNYIKDIIGPASLELKEREIDNGIEETYLERMKKNL